jgi:NAD(P)-dependent dehydrogenase (short-subunit alcohol dehydrogenase family)
MSNYADLRGKVAIVTGAGRKAGLGAAMAYRLADEGAKLVIADIGKAAGPEFPASAIGATDEMESIAADIRSAGGSAVTAVCNVLYEDQCAQLVKTAVEAFGGVDILVNNAGVGYLMKQIIDMSAEEWDAVLGVNLRGVFFCTKHAAKQMIGQARGGKIINIASQAAKSGFPFASAYTASKHGLSAIELAKHKINVNAICPNHVTTGLGGWQNEFFSKALGLSLDEYLLAMKNRIPLGRPGLQSDTANACAFLASSQSDYITGESMNVSGGEEYH